MGGGFNFISTQYDTLIDAEIRQEEDTFLFASIRQGFGGDYSYSLAAELKNQGSTKDADDPNCESDARAITLKGALDGKWGDASGKVQQSRATTDAIGKYKDKTATSLGLTLGYSLGDLNLTLAGTRKQAAPKVIDPAYGIKAEKTTQTNTLTLAYSISKTWMLLADYLTETQESPVKAFNYKNTAYSTSIIFIH